MTERWEKTTLGEVATVSAGNSAPQNKALFHGGKHPFVRTSDVGKIRFGTIHSTAEYLNDEGIVKLRCFPRGTILFPKSGASTFLNHRVMMGFDGYVASHLATIQAKSEKADSRFLLYFLHTVKAQSLVQDQNYPSLNLPVIESIQLSFPPLPEQKRIAAILDEVAAAIEGATANTRKNLANARELFASQLNKVFGENTMETGGQTTLPLTECICHTDIPKKIPRKQFENTGRFPIVSQERNIINGYWSNEADVIRVDTPLVIFGDHTKILKYIDFNFVLGADGVKILQPKSFLIPKYFYYFLMGHPVRPLGYARHFRLLKKIDVVFPNSLPEQKRIIATLNKASLATTNIVKIGTQKLTLLADLKQSLLHKAFSGELTAGSKSEVGI